MDFNFKASESAPKVVKVKVSERRKLAEAQGMAPDDAAAKAASEALDVLFPGATFDNFVNALSATIKATPRVLVPTKSGSMVEILPGIRFPGRGGKYYYEGRDATFSGPWTAYAWASALEGSPKWTEAVKAVMAGAAPERVKVDPPAGSDPSGDKPARSDAGKVLDTRRKGE
jgi:hypothetical protein